MRRYNFLFFSFFFVVLGYSGIALFCFGVFLGCTTWSFSLFQILLVFAHRKKRIILRPTQGLRKYEWNLVAINVFNPCNNVWHGDGPHLVFGHKIDYPTVPSRPFAPIPPTKSNLSNLVQTKLFQPSPICQAWTKSKCSNQVQLVKAGLKQTFPTKSNLSEHQPGLQDVRVLKYFIFEDNTKVLEVIEHQPCILS